MSFFHIFRGTVIHLLSNTRYVTSHFYAFVEHFHNEHFKLPHLITSKRVIQQRSSSEVKFKRKFAFMKFLKTTYTTPTSLK